MLVMYQYANDVGLMISSTVCTASSISVWKSAMVIHCAINRYNNDVHQS